MDPHDPEILERAARRFQAKTATVVIKENTEAAQLTAQTSGRLGII
jgi:hypothetical protein